jgi:hypothetical protein
MFEEGLEIHEYDCNSIDIRFFQRIRVNWMFLIRRPPSVDRRRMLKRI